MHVSVDKTDPVWRALIDKARSGCDDALSDVLDSVRDYLLLIADDNLGPQVRSKFGASDIVQFSMMEVKDSIGDFHGHSQAELRSWLKRIVINNLTDEARRYTHTQSRSVQLEVPAEGFLDSSSPTDTETPSCHMRREEFDSELANAIAQLTNRQKYVIEARHRHGQSYEQIASQLDVSEASVRKIWSRATKQLRHLLQPSQ